jgi:hypothetical protein
MGTSKTAITPSNIHCWLAATGYLFPTTEAELDRFEKLYADMVISEDELIDPDVVLGLKPRKPMPGVTKVLSPDNNAPFSMAARNGKGNIPQHILDKMKKNHQKSQNGDDGSTEKKPD